MSVSRKLVHTIYGVLPELANAKHAGQAQYYRVTGRLEKPDFAGIKLFGWRSPLLLDIGAHRGQSIATFRQLSPDCQIISFEPNPFLAADLARRYRQDDRIKVEACALASASGRMSLFVPTYRRWRGDGVASLSKREAQEWFGPDQVFLFNRKKVQLAEVSVPVRTLDEFALAPQLIKLHAQRGEINILKGATETLARHRPALLCAWVWDELASYLAERGYRPFAFSGGRLAPDKFGREFTWFLLAEHADRLMSDRGHPE